MVAGLLDSPPFVLHFSYQMNLPSLRWGGISGVHSHTHTPTESGANVTVSFKRFSMPASTVITWRHHSFYLKKGSQKYTQHLCDWRYGFHCSVNEANSYCVIAVCRFVFVDPVTQLLCVWILDKIQLLYLLFIATSLGSSDVGFATKLLFP